MKSILIAAFLLLTGCAGSPPIAYFLLTPETTPATTERDLGIGIGPVTVAPHLDRPQIIIRASANELRPADFERWAEPLADNVTRVLAENLSRLLGTDRVAVYPWRPEAAVDYRLAAEVLRADAEAGTAILEVRWSVATNGGEVVRSPKLSSFREPLAGAGEGASAVAAALSRALAELSREIAGGAGTWGPE